MYKTLIILSTADYDASFTDYACIHSKATLQNETSILVNGLTMEFSYLIIEDGYLNEIPTFVISENGTPVCNFFHETSVDNIFYCKSEQINDCIEYLKEN